MSKLQDLDGNGYIGKPKFLNRIGAITGLVVAIGTIATSVVSLVRTINPPSEQKVDIAYDLIKQKLEFIEESVDRNREDLKEFRSLVIESIRHQENLENEKFKELVEGLIEDNNSRMRSRSSSRIRSARVEDMVVEFEENKAVKKLENLEISDEKPIVQQLQLPPNLDEVIQK